MQIPSIDTIVSLDFETSGLNFYEPDFKVTSMSISRIKDGKLVSKFSDNFEEISSILLWLHDNQLPIIVYNVGFEYGVLKCTWPNLNLNLFCDVMRLVQLNDDIPIEQGYSLKDAVRRLIPQNADYESEIKEWVEANIPEGRRRWGKYINQAPRDILERYNNADTENTFHLYSALTKKFKQQRYEWEGEHPIYMFIAKQVVEAKIRGIHVERESLSKYKEDLEKELADVDSTFRTKFAEEIMKVREMLREKAQSKFKKKIVTELPEFNVMSKQHLEYLFVKVLGFSYVLKTPKDQPSFKSSHLHQWGEGGKILATRGKRTIVLNQVKSLLELSEKDGKWHQSLKLVATATGRLAGGS